MWNHRLYLTTSTRSSFASTPQMGNYLSQIDDPAPKASEA